MDAISTDIIALLKYLLPGFLTAWLFYGFTSYPKPSEFERVVQALIFTLIVQAGVYCIKSLLVWIGTFFSVGPWTDHSDLLASIGCAAMLGFALAYFANTDKFHRFFRRIGITKETSYPSEWFGVFSNQVTYVVLHLTDERRIYGWPIEWPSEPGKGHFSLTQVSWLTEEKEIPLLTVEAVLVRAEDVKRVEFMKKSWDNAPNEQESPKPTSSTPPP